MRILIVKTSSLGDIIHAYPAVSFIKEKFPGAIIDWVVEKPFAELLHSHPFVDNVIEVNTRGWRKGIASFYAGIREYRAKIQRHTYDVVFDLQGNIKSALFTFLALSNHKVGFGRKSAMEWPNCLVTGIHFDPPQDCNVRMENLFLVQSYFGFAPYMQEKPVHLSINEKSKDEIAALMSKPQLAGKKVIAVCPGSAWINKRITEEALIAFLQKIENRMGCAFMFIWGSEEERRDAFKVSAFFPNSMVADKLPLSALQNLLDHSDLVIAMDSLPLHLAGTTTTPTFSVFGPSLASKFKPEGDQHGFYQGSCPYGRVLKRRCPIIRSCPTGLCIRGLSGDELFAQFSDWIRCQEINS